MTPPPPQHPRVALSAPGKVLLAGGYLVLDRHYSGLVFGLDARISVVASQAEGPGLGAGDDDQGESVGIVVESPQFASARWEYVVRRGIAGEARGIWVEQRKDGRIAASRNSFVETTLSYALTYIAGTGASESTITPARLTILADKGYYSESAAVATELQKGRFLRYGKPIEEVPKTGLGSSAALVTSLTASLLSHYLPKALFDLSTDEGRLTLHNLAQAAHCAAQGKVGSGFDVAAAVYGSCVYRRFSPSTLANVPEPGSPGFAGALEKVMSTPWDVEIHKDAAGLPSSLTLRMLDVQGGTKTVSMVKGVLGWRGQKLDEAETLWEGLHSENERLAYLVREGREDELAAHIVKIRGYLQDMTKKSGMAVEPGSQTELLDALAGVDGVFGGVVPGAGGYDAVSVIAKNDKDTMAALESFEKKWNGEKENQISLMTVKGETEGVRCEGLEEYDAWLTR